MQISPLQLMQQYGVMGSIPHRLEPLRLRVALASRVRVLRIPPDWPGGCLVTARPGGTLRREEAARPGHVPP